MNTYNPRPFREYNPQPLDRSSEAQQTINEIRARYMLCGPSNYHRSHKVIGWVAVVTAIACIAAAFLIF